jgi:homospermidine synthase
MNHPIYHTITGPIVIVGYGSIGRGVLPLLERHFSFAASQLNIIEPDVTKLAGNELTAYKKHVVALTKENYSTVLGEIFGDARGLIINLSVNVSSLDLIRYASDHHIHYIDTVIEPWLGGYDQTAPLAQQTNFHLREELLALKRELGTTSTTSVSCCGANPGMVSWLTKRALLHIAHDTHLDHTKPHNKEQWAALMSRLGIFGLHIAEHDTQQSVKTYSHRVFTNTWSVDGLISEALQPAELGWGTHEQILPVDGHTHSDSKACGIYLTSKGASTVVQTWVPTQGAIDAFVVTHNEALSIADYFTVEENGETIYRPTVHYAYRPTTHTTTSLIHLAEMGRDTTTEKKVIPVHEITGGYDELGVLLYGHGRNAYWYGSTLHHHQTLGLASRQNATGLQVSSAVIAGIVWLLENPQSGVVEADEMDHERCLSVQSYYLGTLHGVYTSWQPEVGTKGPTTPKDIWQFNHLRRPYSVPLTIVT